MARTVKTTGIANKAFLIVGVEDDGVVKVFKSINSSSADNTSSVQGDMTISGTLTYADVTWAGGNSGVSKTLKTFRSASSSYIQFGTNKPFVPTSTTWSRGMLGVYIGKFHASNSGFITSVASGRIPWMSSNFSTPNYRPRWTGGAEVLADSTATFADDVLMSCALRHKADDTANSKLWEGLDNVALADSGYGGNGNGAGVGNDSISRILDELGQYWVRACAIYMLVGSDYADAAAELTALQGLHNDPYGTLFEAGGGGVVIPVHMNLRRQYQN